MCDFDTPVWKTASPAPLARGTIGIWRVNLDAAFDESSLDKDEQARASRFVFHRDARRYAAGRAQLRKLIGAYLDEAPQALRFVTGQWGKPALAGPDRQIAFNLSHSGDTALIAIGRVAHLGVDVEAIQPIQDRAAIAAQNFAVDEINALEALPTSLQERAFFACWTRKEAIIKLWGKGFSADLASFNVTVDPRLPARVTSITRPLTRADDIKLYSFEPAVGYMAALAVWAADDIQLNFHTLS
jgi:4'-phosphopantetheinyl transferase